jgi:hypothetical protein
MPPPLKWLKYPVLLDSYLDLYTDYLVNHYLVPIDIDTQDFPDHVDLDDGWTPDYPKISDIGRWATREIMDIYFDIENYLRHFIAMAYATQRFFREGDVAYLRNAEGYSPDN